MLLPRHLAIIMDGNGRWAKRKGKLRHFGHIRGTQVAKDIITHCARLGIPFLTLYAFSAENWQRPSAEVRILMKLLKKYLQKEVKALIKENIRFQIIGDRSRLSLDILKVIDDTVDQTRHCSGMTLVFALSYGSRQEILMATKKLAEQVSAGKLSAESITEDLFAQQLQTHSFPDPDLILRTSGEKRISNFLLWQAAYSEFYFSDKLWPEFTEQDLDTALMDYSKRERRYGRTNLEHNSESAST
ncbi:MAG: isoprenyl transferase [Bdellovibrionales bacterium]